MADTLILRFRDLVTEVGVTIAEHRKTIAEAGFTWWGWWKKESEPEKQRVLEEFGDLARRASIRVGLLDRSHGNHYSAELRDVAVDAQNIRSPDDRFTPAYYRDKSLPAWFKLSSIDDLSEAQFVDMFGAIPTGDETLFIVENRDTAPVMKRLSREWLSGRIFAKRSMPPLESSYLNSVRRTRLPSGLILHLSDLHLGKDYGFPKAKGPSQVPLDKIIHDDIDGRQVGLIVVSGDITTCADISTLQGEALDFLAQLCDCLRVPREHVVIVPGNHDIALRDFRAEDYSHERAFSLFMNEFYGQKIAPIDLKQFVLPDGRRLDVLPINSSRLRYKSESNFGYVDWSRYETLMKRTPKEHDEIRIAVLHHHLVAAPREERPNPAYPEAGVSTTLDSGAVIEGLQTHGFQIAMHGHQHVPALSRVARGRASGNGGDLEGVDDNLYVLGAGSAGACSARLGDSMRDNSYNLLSVGADSIEVEARRFNPGSAPVTHFRYRVPLS